MRSVVGSVGICIAQLAGAHAATVPCVPHTTAPARMSAMTYRPTQSAIGWLDSGRTLVFAHVSMSLAREQEWSYRCKESGVFALDISNRTIRKLYGFDQIRTTRGHCPLVPWDGGAPQSSARAVMSAAALR
jgi:hypothetical protein